MERLFGVICVEKPSFLGKKMKYKVGMICVLNTLNQAMNKGLHIKSAIGAFLF
jgi:hypothetical protein